MYKSIGGNLIHETAIIGDNVKLGTGNKIMPYTIIGEPGFIRNQKTAEGTIEIGDENIIGCHVTIMAGEKSVTKIGSNNLIMNKVNIGHNTIIGNKCEIGAGTIVAGHVSMDDEVKIKIACAIRNRTTIVSGVIIGMGAVVVNDVKNLGVPVYGNPATH